MAGLDGSALTSATARNGLAPGPLVSAGRSMDWDDIRVFLAIARHGSLRAAARALGVSQPTVARRLAALELAFGGSALFDRLPDGVHLNAAGEQMVAAAESAEQAMLGLERLRPSVSPVLSGTVRVSTGECAAGFLARCLSGSTTTALHPGITLELVHSQQTADLTRREADLALRHTPPESGDFYVSTLGTFACAVYRRRGKEIDPWVTYTEEQAHYPPARWVQRQVQTTGNAVSLRASSMLMHLEAILGGTGRGVLPCYVGDNHPLLERLTPPIPELDAKYWIIVHRDLRRSACVRAVIDWIRQIFAEHRELIEGAAGKNN